MSDKKTKNVFGKMIPYEEPKNKPAQVPKQRFKQAIWQSFGNVSALAKLLEVNYTSLRCYLSDHPELAEEMKQAREVLVDQAEEYVLKCLNDTTLDDKVKIDLAKFILKSQGKARGWNDSPTIAQQINVTGEVDLQSIFGISKEQ